LRAASTAAVAVSLQKSLKAVTGSDLLTLQRKRRRIGNRLRQALEANVRGDDAERDWLTEEALKLMGEEETDNET
jgi:hypothetical protein